MRGGARLKQGEAYRNGLGPSEMEKDMYKRERIIREGVGAFKQQF